MFEAFLKPEKEFVNHAAPTHRVTQVFKENPVAAVEIGGYSIIEASSLDEALKVLKTHPFIGRGGTLQVNELIGV